MKNKSKQSGERSSGKDKGANNDSPARPEPHIHLELEYKETNENFRALAATRFTLLKLLPIFGGIAIFVLSFLGLSPESSSFAPESEHLWLVAGVSVLGFVATLGIVFYDQRNSELYNALIHRAKYLEELFRSPNSPAARRKRAFGGQFLERPRRGKKLFNVITIGHDSGLALIYGPVLGAWFFPITLALLQLGGVASEWLVPTSAGVALLAIIVFIWQLLRLDDKEYEAWKQAGEQAIFVLVEETEEGFRASAPQLDIDVSAGETAEDVEQRIRTKVLQKRDWYEENGKDVPVPKIYSLYM